MKPKFVDYYMKIAEVTSDLSYAKRLHVGAIVVKDDRIISIGYNGMPAGWENNCEDKVWLNPDAKFQQATIDEHYPFADDEGRRYGLKTKPEVLHAETNAIAKLARSGEHGLDSDLFVTHAPCLDCAKLIYQSGIRRVWFRTAYRDSAGVDFLKASLITVEQMEKES